MIIRKTIIPSKKLATPAVARMAKSSEEIQDSGLNTPLAWHRWGAIIEQVLY
jgi:hypothetical protein